VYRILFPDLFYQTMQSDEKYQSESCPRCGGAFICKPNNIGSCACGAISISAEEQTYISSRFLDCLCNACLRELKYEYYLLHHHNKPMNYETEL
jgi:hypothetical protein